MLIQQKLLCKALSIIDLGLQCSSVQKVLLSARKPTASLAHHADMRHTTTRPCLSLLLAHTQPSCSTKRPNLRFLAQLSRCPPRVVGPLPYPSIPRALWRPTRGLEICSRVITRSARSLLGTEHGTPHQHSHLWNSGLRRLD